MIGNDVIDLTFKSQLFRQFKNSRLNQKIFSLQELEVVEEEDNKTLLRRWSMKEAAYKAYQRLYQIEPKFNPASIHTEIEDSELGFAIIADDQFKLHTDQRDDHIYTYIDHHNPQTSIRYESKDDLIKKLSDHFSVRSISIRKDSLNIPSIHINDKRKPISLTHHGRFQMSIFL